MKQINLYFEDKEMEKLKAAKGKDTWHDLILKLLNKTESEPRSNETDSADHLDHNE